MTSPGGLIRVTVVFFGLDSPLALGDTVFSAGGFAPGAADCACIHAGASGKVKLVTFGTVRGILSATALGATTTRLAEPTPSDWGARGESQLEVERKSAMGCQS